MNKKFLTSALLAIAATHPDGFTVDAHTLEHASTGYAVAVAMTQDSFGPAGLDRVINYVLEHPEINAFGGWLNSDNNMYYFDATIVCNDLQEALEIAKENKQIAIFDIVNCKEIRVQY